MRSSRCCAAAEPRDSGQREPLTQPACPTPSNCWSLRSAPRSPRRMRSAAPGLTVSGTWPGRRPHQHRSGRRRHRRGCGPRGLAPAIRTRPVWRRDLRQQLRSRWPAHDRARPHGQHDGQGGPRSRARGRRDRDDDHRRRSGRLRSRRDQGHRPNIILLAGGVDFGEKHCAAQYGVAALRNASIASTAASGARGLCGQRGVEETRADCSRGRHRAASRTTSSRTWMCCRSSRCAASSRRCSTATSSMRLAWRGLRGSDAPGSCHARRGVAWSGTVRGSGRRLPVFDVGGATTDVHSVTDGSREWPAGGSRTSREAYRGGRPRRLRERAEHRGSAGDPNGSRAWTTSRRCRVRIAKRHSPAGSANGGRHRRSRHAGVITDLYTPTGRRQIVKGKDLTAVSWVVATGGALTRVEGRRRLRASAPAPAGTSSPLPATILIDTDYRFSALGTLAQPSRRRQIHVPPLDRIGGRRHSSPRVRPYTSEVPVSRSTPTESPRTPAA